MMKMEFTFTSQEVKDALTSHVANTQGINISSSSLEITLTKSGAVLKTKESRKSTKKT